MLTNVTAETSACDWDLLSLAACGTQALCEEAKGSLLDARELYKDLYLITPDNVRHVRDAIWDQPAPSLPASCM